VQRDGVWASDPDLRAFAALVEELRAGGAPALPKRHRFGVGKVGRAYYQDLEALVDGRTLKPAPAAVERPFAAPGWGPIPLSSQPRIVLRRENNHSRISGGWKEGPAFTPARPVLVTGDADDDHNQSSQKTNPEH
jgi:hypothetical protein